MRKSFLAETLKKGKRYTNGQTLSMVVGVGEKGKESLIAIAVKKKVGGAVVRNRIRRRVKAAISSLKKKIAKERNIVIFPFIIAKNRRFSLLCSDIEQVFKEAGLLI
jgi:ribonuclease P protein component